MNIMLLFFVTEQLYQFLHLLCVAFKQQKARNSSPPCGKSPENLVLPVTRQQIAPPLLINGVDMHEIL